MYFMLKSRDFQENFIRKCELQFFSISFNVEIVILIWGSKMTKSTQNIDDIDTQRKRHWLIIN